VQTANGFAVLVCLGVCKNKKAQTPGH
jgi:hypothetical protein